MYAIVNGIEYLVRDSVSANYFSKSPEGIRVFETQQDADNHLNILKVYANETMQDSLNSAKVMELKLQPVGA